MSDPTSNQAAKAQTFKALHDGTELFVIPNPWDIGTTRMMEAMGFKALATTSAGFAFSIGVGDGGVTLDQKLDHCRMICAATSLPVNADMEDCFAHDAAGVAESVRRAAATGLVGCSIEDYAREGEPRLYDMDTALERVRAAIEAARALPFPFLITARAEGLLRRLGDMDDTIKRLKAFEEAGADCLYAPGLKTNEDVNAVLSAVSKPVNVLGRPELNVADLAAAGVRRVSVGGAPYMAAMANFKHAMDEIANDGTFKTFAGNRAGRDAVALLSK